MPMMDFGARRFGVGGAGPNVMMESAAVEPPRKSELAPVTHVRKLFPETWLWKSVNTSYVLQAFIFFSFRQYDNGK